MHPDASVGEVSKQMNGLSNRSKPYVAASSRLSSEHRAHREEVFDPVNLLMRPGPSPSWILRFQGTCVFELVDMWLKCQASRNLSGMKVAKPFSGGRANTRLT